MEPRQIIRSGITASAIAHLSVLTLVLFFADVHPFGSVTARPISVDIVSPEEVAQVAKPPVPPETSLFDFSAKSAASDSPAPAPVPAPVPAPAPASAPASRPAAAAPQQTAASTQKQAALSPPPPDRQPAAPPPTSPQPLLAAIPQQPDISIKYNVLLGLPQDRSGDGFDAPASKLADIASDLVTAFRRHLKTCSKLPESIASSDKIKIMLRVIMTPDGHLAADPVLIEASASAKGPALMQSAIRALQACQPYAMLPADKYDEWKQLDLGFTPQDFSGG